MKIQRSENSLKTMIFGAINKTLLLIIPFVVRTIFIHTLGVQYLGLNGLFSSILEILNVAELGIESAIVYYLYVAIGKNDQEEFGALVSFFKKVYKIIGSIVIIIGLSILPFIRKICGGEIPGDINIYILYLLFLVNSSISYFLFAYKLSIPNAYQEGYIISNTNTIVKIVLNLFQALFLILGKSYYIYVILMLVATIIENFLNFIVISKRYPNVKESGELPKDKKKKIYQKVKALFLYKIGGVFLGSVDSVVISKYLGLEVLGQYNNYYYIITALFGFFQVFCQSLVASVGNSIVSEKLEKNQADFYRIHFILSWIVCFCTVCLLCLYQKFMYFWVGEENMFSTGIVILLSILFYVWKMMESVNIYKNAAGLWEYDKYRQLFASAFNLVTNILLVRVIGLYGIILSTIISIVLITFPWSSYVLFKQYFKRGYGKYLMFQIYNVFVTAIACFLTYYICEKIFYEYTIFNFVMAVIACLVVPNLFFTIMYLKTHIFKETIKWSIERLHLKGR